MPEPTFHTFALVVFGGRVFDTALATDFVMIAKKFMADGVHPTCLSGTHLLDITNLSGPFLFGREDLRERVPIYDSQEAIRPFYRLEAHGLKSHIMDWIRNISGQVGPGDRITIVLIGHGIKRDGAVTLYPQHAQQEFLSKAEMIAALSVLPPNVRLLIVNEACYSGTWATIAPDVGAQRDVLVETAATLGEQSWTYTSGSGRNRCSLFGAAFVEELTTHPEGRISQHRSRIVDEMLHVGPDQKTSTPLVIPSARALLSHNISHFILSPKIATAITNVASAQDRHEALLQSRTSARTFWRRIRRRMSLDQEPAQALAGDSPVEDSTGIDMKAIVIENYLKDLGPLKSALDYCTLATACQYALEGRGPPDLQDQVIATIAWQAAQMQRVGRLLEHLTKQGLITDVVDVEIADQALADHEEDVVVPVAERFHRDHKLSCLMNPPTAGHVGIHFNDAQGWLIGILAYNWLMHPDKFDLDRVEDEVFAFLA
ncbi:hypothetical protein P175DRAFT_0501544 [Aspergillus ochraceoroseus IBT 24754]|uniref:Uncharacterized protein n=2 Tax=Aspergillus ochraceoroseus TaxID=138278 RepID=A0A2T5LXF0_9EURO|nr:uncharacterized protein P175DRAFT_0501544 [Aspergillus ochraceoroseus IBT 24754]KKK22844.1 hypothetical protein AOCH_003789 [Aspergillus ochraceoroseus]PTU20913.1 hypothetical protein P175DRAFT_0501544 [Aspergillus ochraceoroseus IBT 24754]